ncbi:nucleotide modification associated domain-containing protein [Vagococcus fluvialis]|uniref:nucleotide modification associated domain-containing protein n=1 Tax=Vagococcus fluvialis TaxID=2738 RepID=UPI0037DD92F1
MKIYHVETQEDYDALMVELSIRFKSKLKSFYWSVFKSQTVIFSEDNKITFGSRMEARLKYPDVLIEKYKTKQNDVQSAIETVSQNNAELFHKIITDLEQTYLAKNKDYGNSFEESLNEFGEVAGIVRIGDKFNRAKNLSKNKANVKDESKIDTYLDMANYNIMQAMWLMKQENE